MNIKVRKTYLSLATLSIIMLFLVSLFPANIISATSVSYNNVLKALDIKVPEENFKPTLRLYINNFKAQVGSLDEYTLVAPTKQPRGWIQTYINSPGLPDLPVLVKVIQINGYIPKNEVKISVKVGSVKFVKLYRPLVPTPQPLAYDAKEPQKIKYIPNEKIYSLDKYFPGTVVDVSVWHGLGDKTFIIIRFYPINYNPLKNELVIINNVILLIHYPNPVKMVEYNKNSVLIITSKKLVNATKPLEKLYEEKGFNVSIETVEQINSTYSPAEPPPYPGFAHPFFNDSVYMTLRKNYDFKLALKIINFLRKHKGDYAYVILVGNAKTVPPSYYYEYPIKTGLGPYNSWIPTDFFYASPDYDFAPDFYVGRIPFSNPELIEEYIQKEISWYNSSVYRDSNKLILSGGYPFLLPAMFGETAISTFVYDNTTSHFNVTIMARTLGNYNNLTVKKIFEGKTGALWYFALAHGSGTVLGDMLIVKGKSGLPTFRFEPLMTSQELLSLKPNPNVPIVSSVACMNAAWDEALVTPTYFMPPSFGEAVLLSPAGGIAYIGSARVAWELTGPVGLFNVINGTLVAQYYGATLLHEEILRAYNMLGPKGATLGEVYERGIMNYLIKAMGLYGNSIYSAIVLSEAFKAELLGDPALVLPKLPSIRPVKASIYNVKALNFTTMINLTKIPIVLAVAGGTMPIYKSAKSFSLLVSGVNGTYSFEIVRVYRFTLGLILNYNIVNKGPLSLTNGVGIIKQTINKNVSGLLIVDLYKEGWGLRKFVLGALGVKILPAKQVAGGLINISGYGLDLFNIKYVNLVIVGRKVASQIPVSIDGTISWSTILPYIAPGKYLITLVPYVPYIIMATSSSNTASYQYPTPKFLEEIQSLLSSHIIVYKKGAISIVAGSPRISAPGKVSVKIETLYNGELVPAELNITIKDPLGREVAYSISGTNGIYDVTFNANNLGTYLLFIKAEANSEYLHAEGSTIIPVSIVYMAYNGTKYIASLITTNNEALSLTLSNISLIRNDLASVETNIGTLLGTAKVIKGNVLEIMTSLGTIELNLSKIIEKVEFVNSTTILIKTKLGDIEGKIVSVNNGIAKISTDLGTLSVNLNGLKNDVNNVNNRLENMNTSLSASISKSEDIAKSAKNYALSAAILSLLALIMASVAAAFARRR